METSKKFNWILIIVYFLITLTALFFHEIWRDEAQAWCIVRDLNLISIFNEARIEGHPILWYLILLPFAKLNLPVISMQIISWLTVFISVIFLVFKSPFNYLQKILVMFSAGMVYFLPIIARNYALIPILIFLLAYFYPKRFEKPYQYLLILLLLSDTHLYMFGFCITCFLIYTYEIRKNLSLKYIIPIIIVLLNYSIIGFSFLFSLKGNYALQDGIKYSLNIGNIMLLTSQVYLFKIFSHNILLKNFFNIISLAIFYFPLLLILYSFFKTDKKIFIICLSGILYILSIFAFVYFNGILYQKIFLIILILIFGLWCTKPIKFGLAGFYVLLFFGIITSPIVINEEIKYNFSGGKEIAQYIKTYLNKENTFLLVGNPYLYSPISAYLPDKKFYNILTQSYISYYSYKDYKKNIKNEYPENVKCSIIQEDIKFPPAAFNQTVEEIGLNMQFASAKENLSTKTSREVFKIYCSNN